MKTTRANSSAVPRACGARIALHRAYEVATTMTAKAFRLLWGLLAVAHETHVVFSTV